MSIIKRMRDISVATLNEKLEKSEDPVRLIDHYLMSQKEQIIQAEKLYQQCVQHTHTMRQQYLSAEQIVQKRAEQARIAVQANEEAVARLALQEKMLNEEKSKQYRELYEQGQQSFLELEAQLQRLKADLQEVAGKRQFYMARLEAIRLQRRMNERMGSISSSGNAGMFNRLEEKVADMEFETRSLRDVRGVGRESWTQIGVEVKENVERELEHLKNKLVEEGWLKR
jgi:phage shock protein A